MFGTVFVALLALFELHQAAQLPACCHLMGPCAAPQEQASMAFTLHISRDIKAWLLLATINQVSSAVIFLNSELFDEMQQLNNETSLALLLLTITTFRRNCRRHADMQSLPLVPQDSRKLKILTASACTPTKENSSARKVPGAHSSGTLSGSKWQIPVGYTRVSNFEKAPCRCDNMLKPVGNKTLKPLIAFFMARALGQEHSGDVSRAVLRLIEE